MEVEGEAMKIDICDTCYRSAYVKDMVERRTLTGIPEVDAYGGELHLTCKRCAGIAPNVIQFRG